MAAAGAAPSPNAVGVGGESWLETYAHIIAPAATLAELVGAFALLAYQGVSLLRWREALLRLWRRVWWRLRPSSFTAVSPEARMQCAVVAGLGTVGLLVFGLASGFLSAPHGVANWRQAAGKLMLMLIMPGLIEEVIFRGLLVPLPEKTGLVTCGCPGELLQEEFLPPPSARSQPTGCHAEREGCRQEVAPRGAHGQAVCTTAAEGAAFAEDANLISNTKDHSADSAAASMQETGPDIVSLLAGQVIFIVYHLDNMHTSSSSQLRHVFLDVRFLVMALILGAACQTAALATGSLWPAVCMHWLWVWGWLTFFTYFQ